MLKLFNKKKKDNKGFTLVELVIVVAILAILVGLLAPQYTKYVEKSRKSADASNLEEIVKQLKVVASDPEYSVPEGTFDITMSHTDGTTITYTQTGNAGVDGSTWVDGMDALLEGTWTPTGTTSMSNDDLKLKSNKWAPAGNIVTGVAANSYMVGAHIEVEADGTTTVTYDPATIKDGTN